MLIVVDRFELGELSRRRESGAYVKEGHAKVYLGRATVRFGFSLARLGFQQDPKTWVLTGSR